MTTTLNWLETYSQGNCGLSLLIENFDRAFATEAMPGTYTTESGNAYANFNGSAPYTGLTVTGSVQSSIQLYAQDIQPDTLEFVVVDHSGNLGAALFREAYSSGHKTYLTASLLAGKTHTEGSGANTLAVKDTTGFDSSGTIYIGGEAITYTSKTSTTFGGTITRGRYSLNQTNSSTAFAPSHLIGNNVTASAVTAPAVTDYPRTWIGTFVHLHLHVKDPLSGFFNKPSDAYRCFSGRIVSYRDLGDGKIGITAKSAIELLNRAVGHEQWTARINEGSLLDSTQDTLYLVNTKSVAYNATASLGFTGTRLTHDKVAELIKAQFETWRAAGTTHSGDLWSIELIDNRESLRYRIQLKANSSAVTGTDYVAIALHERVWQLLGWERSDCGGHEITSTSTGEQVVHRKLVSRNTGTGTPWEIVAPNAPIVYYNEDIQTAITLEASSQVGTFVTQSVSDMGHSYSQVVNGIVQVKGGTYDGAIFSVTYTAGSTAKLKIQGQLNASTGLFRLAGLPRAIDNSFVRLGDASEAPLVRQVWFEHGNAASIMLKLLLSSGGTSGYNHATYDTYTTTGLGISVPSSLVDIPSWEELDDVQMMLLITEPTPFYKFLEPVLQTSHRYVVWRAASASSQPKLTIVRPTLDKSVTVDWALNESNKCATRSGQPDRVRVERAADGIINRVVVKFGYGIDGDATNAQTWFVEDIASQSDYGRRRTVTIEAPGIVNVKELAPAAIAPALAYFSRPIAVAERSYMPSLVRMAPGDSVSITDNYLIDPQTGSRGAVVYGWVLATNFDLASGQGRARVVFLPERLPRVAKWSPSARVDETAGGGGYNAGTKTLTLKAHEFSHSSDSNDALNFANGDKVHIYNLDEATPSKEWFDTINGGPGSTTIVLTTGLAGFDSTKRYVIEADDIVTVQSSQRNDKAFIADDATLSTGGAVPTPYDWGSDASRFSTRPSRDYTTGALQPSSTSDDSGEPVSVHKVNYSARAANNLHAYKTRNVYINQYLSTAGTQTGTTTKLIYIGYIPIYGHVSQAGVRALVARIYGKTSSGTATFTIRSAPVRPSGTSFTSYEFPAGSTSAQFATTSTTLVWSSELALSCAAAPAASENVQHGCWITIEAVASGGGVTATLQGLFVCEKELSV